MVLLCARCAKMLTGDEPIAEVNAIVVTKGAASDFESASQVGSHASFPQWEGGTEVGECVKCCALCAHTTLCSLTVYTLLCALCMYRYMPLKLVRGSIALGKTTTTKIDCIYILVEVHTTVFMNSKYW